MGSSPFGLTEDGHRPTRCSCDDCAGKRAASREHLTPEARVMMDWLVSEYRSWPNVLADGRRA